MTDNDINAGFIKSIQESCLENVKHFIEQGADVHFFGDHALQLAAGNNDVDIVQYLISQGADIHRNDDDALHQAIDFNALDAVKLLINNGADVNALNDYGLSLALTRGSLDIARHLIENGASPFNWDLIAREQRVQNNIKNQIKNGDEATLSLFMSTGLFNLSDLKQFHLHCVGTAQSELAAKLSFELALDNSFPAVIGEIAHD